MTHKQIWTEIQRAFLTPKSEGTLRQRYIAQSGLCRARIYFDRGGKIGTNSFICGLKPTKTGFWFPCRTWHNHRRQYDFIRGDMATLFACMTEKEFNRLVAPKVPKE